MPSFDTRLAPRWTSAACAVALLSCGGSPTPATKPSDGSAGVVVPGTGPEPKQDHGSEPAATAPLKPSSGAASSETSSEASSAAELLAGLKAPPDDPFRRGELYLALGRRAEPGLLEKVRAVAASERDRAARERALAAMVKLRGGPELADFVAWLAATKPDDALPVLDLVDYVGDPAVAPGLVPWLDRSEEVLRIGTDRQNMPGARMSDVAVWAAHKLGVTMPFSMTHIRRFAPAEIAQARRLMSRPPARVAP
jgi:hypothetical protein